MTLVFSRSQPIDPPAPTEANAAGKPATFQERVVAALPGIILRGGLLTTGAFVACGNVHGPDVALLLRDKSRAELISIARIYGCDAVEIVSRVGASESDRLIDIAARAFGVTRPQIRGASRRQRVVMARFFVMFWLYRRTGMSLPAIGRLFGGRDHTTVLNATERWPKKRGQARRARALIRAGQPVNRAEGDVLRSAMYRLQRYAGQMR